MILGGVPYAPRGPRDARERGVAMIYQELTMAPHLTVEANVMLGQERIEAGLVRRGEHRRLVTRGARPPGASRDPSRRDRGHAQRRCAATRRGGAGPGLERPRDRLRRADQLADRTRRRAAVRGDRPAAVARAGDRLHQPFPRGSPADRAAIYGAPRRPDGGLGADGRDADWRRSSRQMVGRDLTEHVPARAAHAGRGRCSS